jgi:uncharacterized protein involved in type VI secretion and phage assembly
MAVDPANTQARSAGRHYGKYRGLVVDVADPMQLGRIRARVPEVFGEVETGWALPAAPYAGDGVGAWAIPPVGANVWMEFEAGDVSRPIWCGCWWGEGQQPPGQQGNTASPSLKIVRSEQGLIVSLDDDGQTISVSDENGSNILTIEIQKGQIMIKAATKAVVAAPRIELVEDAAHPVVLGDNLLQYLNQLVQVYQTHVHPGEMAGTTPVTPAPPEPPLPPASPSLLSTRVTSG